MSDRCRYRRGYVAGSFGPRMSRYGALKWRFVRARDPLELERGRAPPARNRRAQLSEQDRERDPHLDLANRPSGGPYRPTGGSSRSRSSSRLIATIAPMTEPTLLKLNSRGGVQVGGGLNGPSAPGRPSSGPMGAAGPDGDGGAPKRRPRPGGPDQEIAWMIP